MKKKLLLILTSAVLAIGVISFGIMLGKEDAYFVRAKDEPYKMVMNSSKNKFHNNTGSTAYSGEANVKTNLDNDISFSYTDLMGLASTWHVAKSGGGFYNTTPLHGLEAIALSFKTNGKEFKLYWSSSTLFVEEDSQTFTSSSSSATYFAFNDDYPTYFKFVNTSGSNLNVSEVELSFSCVNNYPTLSISSENETMGSVSGSSGVIRSGQYVSITATPNQGYRFIGWYDEDGLISSNATYNFVMDNDDLDYVAHFTYESYSFIVQSESNQKGTVIDVCGYYDYLTPITIEAFAKEGYSFQGWYVGPSLISSNNPYTFDMPYEHTTYTAKFSTNSYNLTLNNANPTLGTISSSNSYLYKSSVTIVASANTGVTFLGWYDNNDSLVSSLATYTFNMPHENLTYTAKFEWTPYTVNLTVNDSSMGSVSGAGSYIYQQEVTLEATPNEHYSFFGWYNGDTLLSRESTYVFNMPNNSLNYEARFVQNHNLYIYSDDESKGSVSFPSEWGEGLEVTVTANGETGYGLDYWYDDDLNEVSYDSSYTFIMPNHDVTLYAAFAELYSLTVTSSDVTKGTVTGGGYYLAGREITVTMNYISGTFKGWFDGDNQFVTNDNPYTFAMPSNDYLLEARFMTVQEEWDVNHGVTPMLSDDGKTITYGLYPQTHIGDEYTCVHLNDITTPEANGWYLFEGEYYAKINANLYSSVYTFDDGIKIKSGSTYWFKCEPIVWNVLSKTDGTYYLLSSVLLDTHIYNEFYSGLKDGHYANNYEYSEIRNWLNNDFYNSAFALDSGHILTTIVDNSASTTDSSSNPNACANTQDKVFLPSYKDYINSSYGFSTSTSSSSTRYCKTTDWARARGAYQYSQTGECANNGYYWTRTPTVDSSSAWCVKNGYLDGYSISNTTASVRPSITLKIA